MTKYRSCTDYWLDTETGAFRGDFEAMYLDVPDPWGCESGKSALNNQIFLDVVFHGDRRFDRIVDVGSGLGGLVDAIAARNGGGEVVGLDVSPTAVRKAAARYPSVEFRCHNLLDAPLEAQPFELAVMSEVLWYVLSDLPLFFQRVSDLISADGRLAIHQYFPANQRYGREQIDGLDGFMSFLTARAGFVPERVYVNHHTDGLVLLSTFQKEQAHARV